jgi:poly-gamma-glutamate synthesis protein (capsule biosynthesis protein)
MFASLLLACALPPPAPPNPALAAPAPPPPPPPSARVRLLATGDVIPHPAVAWSGETYGWDSLFAEVKAEVTAADLAFVNLETPVAPGRDGPTGDMIFNAPIALPQALAYAGFDGVSLANNHVWDQGRSGLVETVGHLDDIGLAWAGAGRTCAEAEAPRLFVRDGITIGWISSTRVHNAYLNRGPDDPCVFAFDVPRILAAAQAARDQGAELVVLSLHWGVEYESAPRSWDRHYAEQLVAGGIDAVLGHHPHVLQPATWVSAGGRRGFVAYSLGNLVTAQAWTYTLGGGSDWGLRRDGGLLELIAERVDGVATFTSARLLPTWTEHGAQVCTGRPPRVRAILLGPALAALGDDPAWRSCATHYRQRLAAVRRVVGAPLVDG